MKILDKLPLNGKTYVCMQIFFLENKEIYRVCEEKEQDSDSQIEEIFVILENGKYQEIKDIKTLEKIDKLLEVKCTDVIYKI